MAEIPEQAAPGPEAVPIPAAEEVLLLADRQEQRPEEAVHPLLGALLEEALPQEVPLEEAVLETAQGGLQEAVPELPTPSLEIIIMKQDVLLPADMAEDAAVRILEKSRLAA